MHNLWDLVGMNKLKRLEILCQQQRLLSQALFCIKKDKTSMSQGQISMPNFVIFASKIMLVLLTMEIIKKIV